MEANHIDTIARFFASRRSRRQAIGQLAAGIAAGAFAATGAAAAQKATPAVNATPATPAATPEAATTPQYPKMLFLQSFQSGSITPKADQSGQYTVTLEHGLGDTMYFSDRPERIVGAGPTAQFLKGFHFGKHNPPNAALVVETKSGATDIAVVELQNPVYDATGPTVSYDMKPLANWEETLKFGFNEASTDLAKLAPTFGTAHLFIDDCPNYTVTCTTGDTNYPCPGEGGICGQWENVGYCYDWSQSGCFPCEPYDHLNPPAERVYEYWGNKCNNTFPSCSEGGRQDSGCYPNI